MSTDPELQTLFFLTLLLTPVMPRAHCPYLFQPSILHSCSIFPRLMPTTAQAGRDGVFLVSPLPLQQSATITAVLVPFPSGKPSTGKPLHEPAVPQIPASSKTPCLVWDLPAPSLLRGCCESLRRGLSAQVLFSDSSVTVLTDQGVFDTRT